MSGDHNMNCSANDPCQELREFQESQNGVFSIHNACCYRNDCKIAWEQFEKLSWEKAVSEMNNEPVAWIKKDTLIYLNNYNYASVTIQVQKTNSVGFDIPLYTAPRELSDEEIIDTFIKDGIYDCINDPYMQSDGKYSLDGDLIRFAKAILKKASEK